MLVKRLLAPIAVISAGFLAACGGSGSGGSLSYQALVDDGDRLRARLEPVEERSETVPTTGRATYTGVAAYGLSPMAEDYLDDPAVVSRVTLDADFADETISGRLDNFRSKEAEISGSVDMLDGKIHHDGPGRGWLGADLAGSLAVNGESTEIVGELYGYFFGDNADVIKGDLDGILDGNEDMPVYGIFGAERR